MAQNILWMQQAREKMFFFAMMLFAVGIWLSLPMFIRKSDLTPITGKLDTAYLNIATVSSTHERYGVSNTSYSQKATLTFMIKGYEQIYSIEKNIGDRFDDGFVSGLDQLELSDHNVEVDEQFPVLLIWAVLIKGPTVLLKNGIEIPE